MKGLFVCCTELEVDVLIDAKPSVTRNLSPLLRSRYNPAGKRVQEMPWGQRTVAIDTYIVAS
jgi:hypothetical protein